MQGRAHVFGDEINTDVIAPSDYFGEPIEVLANHIFEPVHPGIAQKINEGDFIVAGAHFGSGSSRESAPHALQVAGIQAVIAESFSRIFYRNAIAIGLPALTVPNGVDGISDGDKLEADFESSRIENRTSGAKYAFEPIPGEIREVFASNGLLNHYREHPEGLSVD